MRPVQEVVDPVVKIIDVPDVESGFGLYPSRYTDNRGLGADQGPPRRTPSKFVSDLQS